MRKRPGFPDQARAKPQRSPVLRRPVRTLNRSTIFDKPSRVFRHPRMTSHIPVVPVASGLPAFFISEDILKKP